MAIRYTLGAEIDVTGNYKSQLNTFLNAVKRCEQGFDHFTARIKNDTEIINTRLNKMSKTISKYISDIDKIERSSVTSSNKQQERIGKSVEKLGLRYEKLGQQIKDTYANVPTNITIPSMSQMKQSKGDSSNKSDSSTNENALTGLVGSLKGYALKFVGIQAIIKAISAGIKKANEISRQIYTGILDLGKGILKASGLTPSAMLENAQDFERLRVTMNVLAKSEEAGAEVYKNATVLAKRTAFSEKDTAEMAEYVLKGGLLPTESDLSAIGDLASLKPELGAGHAGYSILSWLNGRSTSIKSMYGVDNKILAQYLKKLPDKAQFSKAFTKKGVVQDKEQAFNLLMRWIKEKYGGLAQTQSNTLGGRISTVAGQLDQYGADLIGLHSESGTITNESGAYKAIKDFLGEYLPNENGEMTSTGFMGILDNLVESDAFKQLEDTIGRITKGVLDLVGTATESENLEAFLSMLSNIGEGFADLIDKAESLGVMQQIIDVIINAGNKFADLLEKFATSDEYSSLLQKLPDLIQQSLEYEMKKLELSVKAASIWDGVVDKVWKAGTFFFDTVSGIIDFFTPDSEATNQYEVLAGYSWAKDLPVENRMNGDKSVDFSFGDDAIKQLLDKGTIDGEEYLSNEEKDSLKNYITNDNKKTYDITLEYHNGGLDKEKMFNDLMKLLDEADAMD